MHAFNVDHQKKLFFYPPVEVDDDGPQGREEEVAKSLEDVAPSLAHL